MLQYVIAGLALGGIYAIASAGLVITYISAGVLNFAFGALAYFVARLYYYLLVQQHWGILPAALFSIVFAGPAIGVTLYFALFRFLRLSSPLVKIVATLGLATTIPYLAILCFGNSTILSAPGLAPRPVKVFIVDGVPVDMDKIIVYGCVILVVVLGAVILRFTDIGLRVRAMVDSPAMTSLSGTNPTAVSVGVWAVSIFLAGLSGVLSAPQVGMDPGAYTLLMASAFAAVIAAKLRSLPVAVVVALLMGVAADLIIHYMPPSSSFTAAVIPSIPFVVTALFLVYHTVRTGRVSETAGVGGALDRAIAVQGGERLGGAAVDPDRPSSRALGWGPALFGVAVAALLPLFLHGVWITSVATGIAFGVIFLSFTLVTGEGGMIWLCMITFAGVGALTAGRMVDHYHWPVLAGVVFGGLLALPRGVIIGMLTIRMGDLYVALVTLTFGLLMENLVFSRSMFLNFGMGQTLPRPGFATSDRAFAYLGLVVFAIIGVFIVNLRRSTTGMALTAVKWSEPGSKTIGVSVLQTKVLVAGLAAFVAGIGGALLAVGQGTATPSNYATLAGVVWLAVLVMQGIRSNTAALVAGLTFTLMPTLVQTYAPVWVGNIPPILFGLGAIGVARNPDGFMAMQVRQLRSLAGLVRGQRKRAAGGDSPPDKQESPVPATASLTGSGAV